MELTATRFGNIEYDHDDILTFEEGIIGFPSSKHFVVLNHKPESPFRWLQSIEEPELAFLVTDPSNFVNTYAPTLSDHEAEKLALIEETPRLVFTTVSIPRGNPQGMTVNLAAPIVINVATRCGKQLVLEGDAYTIKHRVFPAANWTSERKAA